MSFLPRILKATGLGCLVLLALAAARAQAPGERSFAFDLPAQPLADALPKVGDITGTSIIFDSRAVAGKRATALQGSFSLPQALDRLLASSGLAHQRGAGRTIAIRPASPAGPASAAEASSPEEPSIQLAPLLVTADGAQRVLVVTTADLETRQASDLEDALSIDPSVTVGGSTGIAQKIYVRNLGEGLLNVSVDGATQAGALFHHVGRTLIEPDLLKQVEVQPGVGNAADGPGTLGGAIRFVTKDPEDLLRGGEHAGALLKYSHFGNTDGYRASATGFGRADRVWSGMVSVVASEHEEIEDGRGNRLPGSDTRQRVILGKIVGTFGGGNAIRLTFEDLDEQGNKLRRPEWAPGPGNPVFYMEGKRQTATLGYGLRPDAAGWLDAQATFTYTQSELLQVATFGPYVGDIESWQVDLRNTHRFGGHSVVYGIDRRRDEVTAGPRTAPRSYAEIDSVTGAFAQGEFRGGDKLTVNAGARADAYRLRDRQNQRFAHNGFSPNLGATYAFTPGLSLNASVATAYRGPHINDAFRIDIARNDPALAAEKAVNTELRALYRRGALQLEGGGYVHRIDDAITNTLPWSSVYTNAGDLKTDGFFARVSYHLDNVRMDLQFNRADTTIDGQVATRYQYSSLVSRIGNTWVGDVVWRASDQLDLGWNARLVQGVDRILVPETISELPGTYIDKPGYATHDVYLRWRPAFVRALTVTLTVKNAFDKYYLSHGSVENLTRIPGFEAVVGAPEAGRDIRVSASLRF